MPTLDIVQLLLEREDVQLVIPRDGRFLWASRFEKAPIDEANFIEYTPIFLLSLIGIEWLAVENIPYYFLYINIVGSLFIIGRILHALSLYEKKNYAP